MATNWLGLAAMAQSVNTHNDLVKRSRKVGTLRHVDGDGNVFELTVWVTPDARLYYLDVFTRTGAPHHVGDRWRNLPTVPLVNDAATLAAIMACARGSVTKVSPEP